MEDLQGMPGHQLHSILVFRHGKLVFEEYSPGPRFSLAQYTGGSGFYRDDTHNLPSVTRSFTATFVGIAIHRGNIPSLDSKVIDFFPEHSDLLSDDLRLRPWDMAKFGQFFLGGRDLGEQGDRPGRMGGIRHCSAHLPGPESSCRGWVRLWLVALESL